MDQILDVAGQKGTGRWTSMLAIELGVPLPTVTAAVDARALSAGRDARLRVAAAFAEMPRAALAGIDVEDLRAALYAAKLMSYTQGFALLRQASDTYGFGTDLAAVSRIWKAGCIIRAAFLDRVYQAFRDDADLPLLLLAPSFQVDLQRCLPALRRVVAGASLAGVAIPALSASLAYFDTLATARGSASLIQAQRDFFGAHTYQRFDQVGVSVHTRWS